MTNTDPQPPPPVLPYETINRRPRSAMLALIGTLAAILAVSTWLIAAIILFEDMRWMAIIATSGIAAVLSTAAYWWLKDYYQAPAERIR